MDQARMCAKCDAHSVGPGGILCPACLATLAQQARDYWRDRPPGNGGALLVAPLDGPEKIKLSTPPDRGQGECQPNTVE